MGAVMTDHTTECIFQDGQKYCETHNLAYQEVGAVLIVVVAIFALAAFSMKYGIDNDLPFAGLEIILGIFFLIGLFMVLIGLFMVEL